MLHEFPMAVLLAAALITSSTAQQRPAGLNAGDIKTNAKDGQQYAWIPAGTFTMGCSAHDSECDGGEPPPHVVSIAEGFWMGRTEVTVGAYRRFVAATGGSMPPESPGNPGWQD